MTAALFQLPGELQVALEQGFGKAKVPGLQCIENAEMFTTGLANPCRTEMRKISIFIELPQPVLLPDRLQDEAVARRSSR